MLFVISGYQIHNPGKYIILKNKKYVILYFFGVQLMKNACSPKIVSDPLSDVHLPPKNTQATKIRRYLKVPPTPIEGQSHTCDS